MKLIIISLACATVVFGPDQLLRGAEETPPEHNLARQELARAKAEAERAYANAHAHLRQAERARAEVQRARRAELELARAAQTLPGEAPDAPEPPQPPDPADALSLPVAASVNALEAVDDALYNLGFNGPGRSLMAPLVVGTGELKSDRIEEVQQDLNIMSRILNKTVERTAGRGSQPTALGITVWGAPGARAPSALYLEGFGAVFTLNVKFPLVEPPSKDDREPKPEAKEDTAWEKTKRELYGGRRPSRSVGWLAERTSQTMPYDAEKIATLKRGLIEALQNAANLRHLGPSDTVVVAVLGGSGSGPRRVSALAKSEPGDQAVARVELAPLTAEGNRSGAGSTLTLRAKKADIDDFAKGTLSLNEFTKKVAAAAY